MLCDHTTKSRFPVDDRICHNHRLSFFFKYDPFISYPVATPGLRNKALVYPLCFVMAAGTCCMWGTACMSYNLLEEVVAGWLQEKEIISYPLYHHGFAAVNIFTTKQC
jgi:hypothetical protein